MTSLRSDTLYVSLRNGDVDRERVFQSLPGGPPASKWQSRDFNQGLGPQSSRFLPVPPPAMCLILDTLGMGQGGGHRPLQIGKFRVQRCDEPPVIC